MDETKAQFFTETVQQNRRMLYHVALSILHAEADAEDAVSIAVEAAWRRLDRLRELNALPAYLFKSTVNAAKSELRKRKRLEPVEDLSALVSAPSGDTRLFHYVAGLKEPYRIVLLLRYGENLSIEAVARLLRISPGTVASRVSRALDTLRKDLREEESGHA